MRLELNQTLPHPIRVVGFDAPTRFCPPNLAMRKAEKDIRAQGCGIFKTPTEAVLRKKTTQALDELLHNPKALRGGFSIWMLLAIEWAQELSQYVELIEVFPNYFWKHQFGSDHKNKVTIENKLVLLRSKGVEEVNHVAQWSDVGKEDATDAAYCAWVAAQYVNKNGVRFAGDLSDAIYFAL